MKKRVFVDMDGTLAVWNKGKKTEDLYQPGYFAELVPQPTVVEAIKILANQCKNEVEVFTLSTVLVDNPYAIPDKNRWLDRYLPEINAEHRIFVPGSIPKYLAVPDGIRANDTLLDDYTANLVSWSAFARGVKILNGINHSRGTWLGEKVHKNDGAEAIVKTVLAGL